MGLQPQILHILWCALCTAVVCPLGENKRSLGVTTTSRFADKRSDNMVSTVLSVLAASDPLLDFR